MRAFFLSFLISLVLTATLSQVQYKRTPLISSSPNSYETVKGFPLAYQRISRAPSVVVSKRVQNFPLFANFLFWLVGTSALFYLLFTDKKPLLYLVLVVAFSGFLMLVDLKTSSSCLKGYPVRFFSGCSDIKVLNSPSSFYALLDYSFWLVPGGLSALAYKIYKKVKRKALPKLVFGAFVLTLLSLTFNFSCGGFFCLFPSGRGYPIAFSKENSIVLFLFDYAFWLLTLGVLTLLLPKAVKILFKRKN